MSLLDDLAEGQIDMEHNCLVPTKFGRQPRKESTYLFAYESDRGEFYHCICGRRFKAVNSGGGYVIWKER